MKICAITDLHGQTQLSPAFTSVLTSSDLLIIAGDITHFGNQEDARHVLQPLKNLNIPILAVHGNCDQTSVNQLLVAQGINLHGESRIAGNTTFYGLGGSNTSPFHTFQESAEADIEKLLQRFHKTSTRFHILVSHAPPKQTKVDKVLIGAHVGSTAVRAFIEQFQPDCVICGHIHEARGIDTIGPTIIINPGTFPKHYALITTNNELHGQLSGSGLNI